LLGFRPKAGYREGRETRDMTSCPACKGPDVRTSHRQGFLERALLTWLRVFPFRCCQCRTRFYRFVPRSPRRRGYAADGTIPTERHREPRWPIYGDAVVTVTPPGQASVVLKAVAVNASLEGVRLQLPIALEEDSQVDVALDEGPPRTGTVRWARPLGESDFLHGVRFHAPADRRGTFSRPLRHLGVRTSLRRGLILLISAASIAIAAYGLVWLIEAMRTYDPKFYEPKDLERERHELQRKLEELKQPQKP